MNEPRDERELKANLELSTPRWLPGGRVGVEYRRTWDKRAGNFLYQAAEAAGVDEETLLQRIGEGDAFADVFQAAGRRAIEDGDLALRDVLTRLVAAALHDDARIHEVSYLLTKLEGFQPIHIRIIAKLSYLHGKNAEKVTVATLASEVNASEILVMSALAELEASRFAHFHRGATENTCELEPLGVALSALIEEFGKQE